jgi:hypothetical protein
MTPDQIQNTRRVAMNPDTHFENTFLGPNRVWEQSNSLRIGMPMTPEKQKVAIAIARGCSRCSLQGTCRAIRAATKKHFRWSIHNLVAHPLSEVAWLVGLRKLSDWLHDKSTPTQPL